VLRLSTPLETLAGAGWFPLPRVRLLALASLFTLLSPAMPTHSALAQQAGQPATPPTLELPVLRVEADAPQSASRTIGGNAPTGPCVIVDIAGDRAGHLDCATQRLQDAARTAQSEARAAIDAPVIGAGSPMSRRGSPMKAPPVCGWVMPLAVRFIPNGLPRVRRECPDREVQPIQTAAHRQGRCAAPSPDRLSCPT
jgi:hypothetical protein